MLPLVDTRHVHVSYTISDRPDLKMVMGMLGKAFAKDRKRNGLILRSNQGWHYLHASYQKSLRDHDIVSEYSDENKPAFRNGGNRQTGIQDTALAA